MQRINKKKKDNELINFAFLLFGCTLCTLGQNLFLFPYKIIYGFSGLALIANSFLGIKISLFLAISNLIVIILSIIILGFDKTKKSIVGALIYPLLLEITSYLTPIIDFSSVDSLIMIICGGLLNGFGMGLVYKVGYSTGGSDIVNQIIAKLFKKPMGTCIIFTSSVIIFLAFLEFGLQTVIYSIIISYIISIVVDKVMIGISESKKFTIITENETEVKKFLINNLSHSVTVIPARGGYTGNVVKMIMCVIPNKEYVKVKEELLKIDENAVILVSDVYEALGNK